MNLKGKGREKKRDRTSSKEEVSIIVEGAGKDDMAVDETESKLIAASTSNSITNTNESPSKSRKLDSSTATKSPPRYLIDPLSLFSEPLDHVVSLHSGMTTPGGLASSSTFTNSSLHLAGGGGIGGDKLTLGLGEVAGAYNEMQINQLALKANGMKNWRGGLKRLGRLGLI